MQEAINGLLVAVAILIVSQITQFIRSLNNTGRIKAVEQDSVATKEEARLYREKIENEREALINRVMKENLDRIDRLVETLAHERDERKLERADWREDRDEWKKERAERDARDKLLNEQVASLKRELEAVKRELDQVRDESSDRELIIKEQSKTIEAQAETISRHEKTITQQAARITALETQVAELEKQRVEGDGKPPGTFPMTPHPAEEILRKTDQLPKVNPQE